MSYNLIALIVLIMSFLGINWFLIRKIPIVANLPDDPEEVPMKRMKDKIVEKTKELIKKNHCSFEIFLQKTLSKVRIWSLKIDNKTFNWIQTLRNKAQKRKIEIDLSAKKNNKE